jgi:hypothetical protein
MASANDGSSEQRQATEEQRGQKVATVLPDAGSKPDPAPSTGPPLTEMPPTQQQSVGNQPPTEEESGAVV